MHTVHVGLGANTGDRQATILAALQRLRREARVERVSAFYETAPAGGASGPPFLNIAARLTTALDPQAFERFACSVETALGRAARTPLDARPIDIDILLFDDLVADFGRFAVPHPYLATRPYNLIPLAEIAADVIEPRSGKTIAELSAAVAHDGVERKERAAHFVANRQEEEPEVRLSLNRVGVSSVRHPIRLCIAGVEDTYPATFSMVADLAPDKAGVHMSRFSELLEEATLDVIGADRAPVQADALAERIARRIVETQHGALRADVRLRVPFALERWTPVSGKRTQETYMLIGIAHADADGAHRVVGVEVEGMTACPCAQGMVREHAMRELGEAGFSAADAARALDALPVATHNQRGLGSLFVGTRAGEVDVRAEDLVELIEASMSSETYGLLKRPDEFFVVNKAHHNPKFVEDVVRGILARVLDVYGDLPDEAFLSAGCVNDESIHKHDAFAEAFGLAGEFRRELHGAAHVAQKTDLASWLGTRPSPLVAG